MYLGRVGGLTLIYAAISNKNQSGAKLPLEISQSDKGVTIL